MELSTKLPADAGSGHPTAQLVVGSLDINQGAVLPAEELVGRLPQVWVDEMQIDIVFYGLIWNQQRFLVIGSLDISQGAVLPAGELVGRLPQVHQFIWRYQHINNVFHKVVD
jgi:hypothetical protein